MTELIEWASDHVVDADALTALVAAGIPDTPPREWFQDPGLVEPTPLTITADGQVYGHVAAWGTRHIGMAGGPTPPRSRSNYKYFRTGLVATAEGSDVAVGQLTLSGGHAPIRADARAAVEHYDNTASAVADVNIGEDRHGIWVAGALRPGIGSDKIRALRASAPSGDWRPINGNLELVAVCQVNVPGFPVARSLVASAVDGTQKVYALVAAGARELAMTREVGPSSGVDSELVNERIATLESQVEALVASARANRVARINESRQQAREALRGRVSGLK